jgi:hypothetical protein
LFGVTSTRARTRGTDQGGRAIGVGQEARGGLAGQGLGASTPRRASDIWWLKNHGAGRSTASPGAAMAVMARLKATLAPAGDADVGGLDVAA